MMMMVACGSSEILTIQSDIMVFRLSSPDNDWQHWSGTGVHLSPNLPSTISTRTGVSLERGWDTLVSQSAI